MFGRKRTEQVPIAQEEWDFSEIEPWDTEVCLRYELAREVENPAHYFSCFQNLDAVPFLLQPLSVSAEMVVGASDSFRHDAENTYLRPLEVTATEDELGLREVLVGMYFQHPDKSVRAYPVDLQSKPWQKLDPDWRIRLSLHTEQYGTGFLVHSPYQLNNENGEQHSGEDRLKKLCKRYFFVGSVDWRKSDANLIAGFTKWLEVARPKEMPSKTEIGRQSPTDRLNALSALRLRHCLSVEGAVTRTKAVRGKALYAERPAWDRAQKRAILLFRAMYPAAGDPASTTKISNRPA